MKKLKELFYKALRWWRIRHIRRRFKKWGVPMPTDYPQLPVSELAYVCPFSNRTGDICTMEEKFQGILKKWTAGTHGREDLKLHSLDDLLKEYVEAQNAAAAGDKD